MGIKLSADGGPAVLVRVSLVVMNDPIARPTNTGTRVCELECQNDDEERVQITAWREHADRPADNVKNGNKVYNVRFAYGALPYALHYSNGSNFTVVDDSYRLAGMPPTALEDLEADIDFLQNNLVDPRVRIRRVKARVSADGLSPFCQGVIGSVLAYDQYDRSKTLALKLQIEFVPPDKRKVLTAGTLLDMRGMVALPQLQGDPVEFRVASFTDDDVRDNGLGPWLETANRCEATVEKGDRAVHQAKATAFVVSGIRGDSFKTSNSLRTPTSSVRSTQASSVVEVTGTELTMLKGVVMDDFATDAIDGVHLGSVYVKDLRSDVTVTIHGAAKAGVSAFKEGRMVEMRGVLYEEGEQRGVYACFDVFVKDGSGKCVITVAVIGDLRDVQTSEMIEKEVDFKGTMKANEAGELEFVVAGWADVIPSSVRENNTVAESPSITSLNKNFDFMSTASPSTKGSTKVMPAETNTAAVAAGDNNGDVTVVDSITFPASALASVKKEKEPYIASDPAFSMLQTGGGQIEVKNRRQSSGSFQRPTIPAPRPRSTRKSAPAGDGLVVTPSKKAKPSTATRGSSRRGSNWLNDLTNLQQEDGLKDDTGNAAGEGSCDEFSSSTTTFNDAHSNFSVVSDAQGTGRVDFSAFVDDEAKEAKGGFEEEDAEEAGEEDGEDGRGR
ncbi:hypothetical protein AAVH_19341 [Aphelenchoides avenae]|nr:hypothetical protein AAVH_19341 [Aphelenchus avenae]